MGTPQHWKLVKLLKLMTFKSAKLRKVLSSCASCFWVVALIQIDCCDNKAEWKFKQMALCCLRTSCSVGQGNVGDNKEKKEWKTKKKRYFSVPCSSAGDKTEEEKSNLQKCPSTLFINIVVSINSIIPSLSLWSSPPSSILHNPGQSVTKLRHQSWLWKIRQQNFEA